MVTYDEVLPYLEGLREYDTYCMAICPFHFDRSPSLKVTKKGYFVCLSCNTSGGLSKLHNKLKGWTPPVQVSQQKRPVLYIPRELSALERVMESAHQILVDSIDSLGGYIEHRKLTNRIEPNKIGYYNGWYSIPVYGRNMEFQGGVFRAGPRAQAETNMRYLIPKGQPPLLYSPNWQRVEKVGYITIVFGIFDALAMEEMGIPVITPTNGQLSIKPDMLEWCRKRIIIIPDAGEEETASRLANGLGWRGRVVHLPYGNTCKDPADMLQFGREQEIKEML